MRHNRRVRFFETRCSLCVRKRRLAIITAVPLNPSLFDNSRSQWSSGSTLACCARGPRFDSRCGQKVCAFHRNSLRYADLGTGCTLTAVPRSTQPSTLRRTANEYQPYGWVLIIQMAMGECSDYSSILADSKVKFVASPPYGADRLSSRWPKVNFRIWLAPHYKYRPVY